MTRALRLLRAIQTIGLAILRTVLAPAWTRDFLAYVYSYRPIPYAKHIKTVALNEVIGEITTTQVKLRKCFPGHGNMTVEEVMYICLLVGWKNPKAIFEFGTFNGNTTLQMALNAPSGATIYTLNLPPGHGETKLESSAQDKMVHPRAAGSGQTFQNENEQRMIKELFGDSATFDFTPYIEKCDLVLVDAGHEYDYVKCDTDNALRLLSPIGGVIIWHDFPNAPGVCTWLEEFGRTHTVYHIRNTRLAFSLIGSKPSA